VVAWGKPGSATGSAVPEFNRPVLDIYAGESSFVALLDDYTVVPWGKAANGPPNNDNGEALWRIATVFSTTIYDADSTTRGELGQCSEGTIGSRWPDCTINTDRPTMAPTHTPTVSPTQKPSPAPTFLKCAAGSYHVSITECALCPVNFISGIDDGTQECTECPAGTNTGGAAGTSVCMNDRPADTSSSGANSGKGLSTGMAVGVGISVTFLVAVLSFIGYYITVLEPKMTQEAIEEASREAVEKGEDVATTGNPLHYSTNTTSDGGDGGDQGGSAM
jgi:hypothetical protein